MRAGGAGEIHVAVVGNVVEAGGGVGVVIVDLVARKRCSARSCS